ncbi:insulin-like growth factor-binding protein complex acid labile subunit [Neocloeon triangulifer]|uniref:insulin-like growth factor-binding protein complex acid labile subunit n=1 Tax=Neocloeon triangulifer TaxID=2078957 RepID=UPI00286F85C3|nr:insulin-like growth factor-binding protein complex acid labile subunit [Neocloeon triangulifer]
MSSKSGLLLFAALASVVCGEELQCPSSCYCDEISRYIHCEGDLTKVTKIPQKVPRYVERLELREFRLGALRWETTRGAFPNKLIELSIRHSDITELINGSMVMLNHLSNLDISHNGIQVIHPGTLDNLVLLRHLDLGWNKMKDVKGIFVGLKNLETLNLCNNKLESLSFKTFGGLQRLQWLDLSENKISSVEPGTFLPMPGLERLVLSLNPLKSLQRFEFLGSRLRYMDVSNLKLKRVPESLGPSVRELHAVANELSVVRRGDFESYPNLNLLDLSVNQLEIIEDDALGRLESLLKLWLSNNKLSKIPKSLPRLLNILILDYNQISAISKDDLVGLPKLKQLSLRGNKITQVESVVFNALPGLRQLDLAQNLLNTATLGPNGLEEVDLSDNPGLQATAEHIPHLRTLTLGNFSSKSFDLQAFVAPLTELSTLNLAGSTSFANQLLELQLWFGVKEVNLQNCSLKSLPASVWARKGKLRALHLSLNPWNCTHDFLAGFTKRDGKVRIVDAQNLVCDDGAPIFVNVSADVSAEPSLPPTRTQILAPTSIEPNATSKPQSTLPLKVPTAKITQVADVQTTPAVAAKSTPTSTKTPQIIRKPTSMFLKIAKLTEKMLKTENRVLEKSRKFSIFTPTTTTLGTTEPAKAKVTIPNETHTVRSTETTAAETTAEINREAVTMNYTLPATDTTEAETEPPPPLTTTAKDEDFESGMIIVGGEEFYDEPLNRNYSEAQAAKFGLPPGVASNVPVGLIMCLSSLTVSMLLILFVYHCRLKYKWAVVNRPEDEPMDLRVLNSYRDNAAAADNYRSEYGPLDVRY